MMRVYRLLLRLLPPELRRRFGPEMQADLRHRLAETKGVAARLRVVAAACADLVAQAVALRGRNGRTQGGWTMTGWTRDVRLAVRGLRSAPGFTVSAVVTLTLAIGGATAVFSAVRAVLLAPLPYADADRLVTPWPEVNANAAMVHRMADDIDAFDDVSGISSWSFTLVGDGDPEELSVARVTANHFDVLGVRPLLGRTFRPEEEESGRGDVAVLSYGLWVRRFGADPDIVGQTIDLAGADHDRRTVIGVMGEDFRPVRGSPQAWTTIELKPGAGVAEDDTWFVNYRVARLAPGATPEQAREQLQALAVRLQKEVPTVLDQDDVRTVTVPPVRTLETGDVAPILWLVLGAVGLVLLLASANVANLLLARGHARQKDVAVQRALGASRGQIAARVFSEAVLMGVLGVAGGILFAKVAVALLVRTAPELLPRSESIHLNGPVLAFALAITGGAMVLFGALPAYRASRVSATEGLATGTRSGARHGSGGLARWLVAVQMALALILATGASLTLRSLRTLSDQDPGFPVDGLLTFRVSPPADRYGTAPAHASYYRRLTERLEAVPGVTRVGGIQLLPLTDSNWGFPLYFDDAPLAEGASPPSVAFRVVTPGYLEALGVPLLQGRLPEAGDNADAAPVTVVNQALADRFWAGQDPLGKEFHTPSPSSPALRVVGVVGSVRQFGLERAPQAELYIPEPQYAWGSIGLFMVARTEGDVDPAAALAALRDATWDVDPRIPVSDMRPMARVLGDNLARARFLAILLAGFGVTALVLGAVGVYGVTAFHVNRRRSEFGLRQALGASPERVLGEAVRSTLAPVLVGGLAGVAGVLAAGGVLARVLYETSPRDLSALLAAAALLGATALAAIVVPARRATRLDPGEVLRDE